MPIKSFHIVRLLTIFLISLNSHFAYASYDSLKFELNKAINSFDANRTIKVIDSGLSLSSLSEYERLDFRIAGVKSLEMTGNHELIILDSDDLIANNEFAAIQEVRLRLIRALAFEILNRDSGCLTELTIIKGLFENLPKDSEEYGAYLFRKCSFYRVNEKESTAKHYARLAEFHAEMYLFPNNLATSYMLRAFTLNEHQTKQQINYLKKAKLTWESVGDMRGAAMTSVSIASLFLKSKDLDNVKRFADTALQYRDCHFSYYINEYSYEILSSYYQEKNQLDSALLMYKQSVIYKDKSELLAQEIRLEELGIASKEKSLKEENQELEEKNNIRSWGIFLLFVFVVLLIGVLVYILHLLQRIKSDEKILKEQKEVLYASVNKLEESVVENQFLLKEVNHRVKNNLAFIVDLIEHHVSLEKDENTKLRLKELANRINALVMAQRDMYSENSKNVSQKSVKDFLNNIGQSLVNLNSAKVDYKSTIEDVELGVDTLIPLGIIVNELISNSLKHSQTQNGDILKIDIMLSTAGNRIKLKYWDNGIKMAAENMSQSGMGLFLLEGMVRQLKGEIRRKDFEYLINLRIK